MPRAQHAIDENKLNAFTGQMLSDFFDASTARGRSSVPRAGAEKRSSPDMLRLSCRSAKNQKLFSPP